jgi:hypothetical protein
MGEAKRRGTAAHKDQGMFEAFAKAPHYAMIVDDSPRSKYALEKFLSSLAPPIGDSFMEKIKTFRELSPKYIAILGTHRYTGGTTVMARNDIELLEGVMPALIQRLATKGGMCAFALSLTPDMEREVQSILAEMQAGYNESGHYVVPERLKKAIERDATPPDPELTFYGGEAISYKNLVFDPEYTKAISALSIKCIKAWEASPTPQVARAMYNLPLERLPNGHLMVTGVFPDETTQSVEVPCDGWRYMDEDVVRMREAAEQKLGGSAKTNQASIEGEEISLDSLEVTGDKEFQILLRISTELLKIKHVAKPTMEALRQLPLKAYVMPDGQLRVVASLPNGESHTVKVPNGAWHQLDRFATVREEITKQFFNPADKDKIHAVQVARGVIEGQGTSVWRDIAGRVTTNRADCAQYVGKLAIFVDGFNEDPRELYEIENVRSYFRKLHLEWPTLLYFVVPQIEFWKLYFSLIVPTRNAQVPSPGAGITPMVMDLEQAAVAFESIRLDVEEMLKQWGPLDAVQSQSLQTMQQLMAQLLSAPVTPMPRTN